MEVDKMKYLHIHGLYTNKDSSNANKNDNFS